MNYDLPNYKIDFMFNLYKIKAPGFFISQCVLDYVDILIFYSKLELIIAMNRYLFGSQ